MRTNKAIGANLVRLKANRGVGGNISRQAGAVTGEARKEIHVNAGSP
jgi:hypothetical protein